MILRALESAAGLALALLVLHDVFATAVVPGHGRCGLMLSQRVARLALPLSRRRRGEGVTLNFAPIVLVTAFATWLVLLELAFALLLHACADAFTPSLSGFGQALYVAGGALTTMGFGTIEPHGVPAVVVVVASFCGLAVVTMAVTYLLEVQSNIGRRDTGVLKITVTAGEPPSAAALLERYAALDMRDELVQLLRDGRDWCATVMQSHASHPSLIYFRSAGTGSGWPAALGALVDLALLIEFVLDEPRLRGPAVLLRAQARRLSGELTGLLRLEPVALPDARRELAATCELLRQAGYRLRGDIDTGQFADCRQREAGPVLGLAQHLGVQGAPLAPGC